MTMTKMMDHPRKKANLQKTHLKDCQKALPTIQSLSLNGYRLRKHFLGTSSSCPKIGSGYAQRVKVRFIFTTRRAVCQHLIFHPPRNSMAMSMPLVCCQDLVRTWTHCKQIRMCMCG